MAQPNTPDEAPQHLTRLGPPIILSGEFGVDQHLRSYLLGTRHFSRKNVFLLCGLVMLSASLAVLTQFVDLAPFLKRTVTVGYLTLPVLAVLLPIGLRWVQVNRIRRSYDRGLAQPIPAAWTISEDGLVEETESVRSQSTWSAYSAIRVSDDMILLYHQSASTWIALPREFCREPGDWDRLDGFVRAKFSEKP